MSPAFVSGATTYFSQATLTFDEWHVLKLLHKHLDTLGLKWAGFSHYIRELMSDISAFFRQKDYA